MNKEYRKVYRLHTTVLYEKLVFADSYDDAMGYAEDLCVLVKDVGEGWTQRITAEDAFLMIDKDEDLDDH